jgi:hypothetical protein
MLTFSCGKMMVFVIGLELTLALVSLLTNEVLAPLKEGAITNNSPALALIVWALLTLVQQSTIPMDSSTEDATNHLEENYFIRGIPSDLICHVSKKHRVIKIETKKYSNWGKGQISFETFH